ncbi:MAG: UDP-N-acetylmuramoyl-L-alanyl-D-glutamate--2,6-diaminopimelate ligase [Rhodospirillales bacterium]|nr:UDP-N-acetylmuramoyl-L-alanyl-D-glutamate--2,6-diaminopimelate ligase [Rhodospirillales bacterium]
MELGALLKGFDVETSSGKVNETVNISGLTADSRLVEAGYLFAALPGSRVDGRAFIDDARARGAAAILAPRGTREKLGPDYPPVIESKSPRRHFALMAARFFDLQPETVVAVTGTNGKTSVASFARQIWSALGRNAASMGTLGIETDKGRTGGGLTTADPVTLHRALHDLAREGVEMMAIEASSHGLDQHRLDGVRISYAAFTNLSRDHLDYHGTMAAYLASKARLFTEVLQPGGCAVLNADVPEFKSLRAACYANGRRVLDYGTNAGALRIVSVSPSSTGQKVEFSLFGKARSIDLPLAGRFQVWNAVAALGLVLAEGAEAGPALDALEKLAGVPGRLQRVVSLPSGAAVYVDYAHTPDALATVLDALRPHAGGRLAVVFGCGGDRDSGKRPEMGAVAAERADAIIVTDDNPRSEDPAEIRAQIVAACPGAQEIGDRARAIATAMAALGSDDLLLVAGKGHETGQIIGNATLPFDDAVVVRDIAGTMGGAADG